MSVITPTIADRFASHFIFHRCVPSVKRSSILISCSLAVFPLIVLSSFESSREFSLSRSLGIVHLNDFTRSETASCSLISSTAAASFSLWVFSGYPSSEFKGCPSPSLNSSAFSYPSSFFSFFLLQQQEHSAEQMP